MTLRSLFMAAVLSLALSAAALAGDGIPFKKGERIHPRDMQAKLAWYPLLKLGERGPKEPAGLLYVTMKPLVLINGATVPFFDNFYLLTDWKDGDIDVKDVFTPTELMRGRVLAEVKDAPIVGYEEVVSAAFKKWNDSAFDVDLKLLRDATNIIRDKRVKRTLSLEINSKGQPLARYKGREIYYIEVVPKKIAGNPVGISRLRFYAPDGTYLEETSL